jgi:GNAT superfamily N-acetyltransferase
MVVSRFTIAVRQVLTLVAVRQQIGLARVVTDEVSFAYLTDFYILSQHQGKGLGKWVLRILDDVFSSWPHLRRLMLITDSKNGKPFYQAQLEGSHELDLTPKGYVVMEKLYDGAPGIFR